MVKSDYKEKERGRQGPEPCKAMLMNLDCVDFLPGARESHQLWKVKRGSCSVV